MGRHLHIDPFAGIAGDMFLAAFIHMGLRLDDLRAALADVPIGVGYELAVKRVMRQGIDSTNFNVEASAMTPVRSGDLLAQSAAASHGHHHAHADGHVHTRYADIVPMVDALHTAPRGKDRARRIVRVLAEAEALVHGMSVADVTFHEVGAVDSIVDMFGAAVALELMEIDTVSCGPLPVSRGFVRCQHGKMPVPAPATAYLLRDVPVVGMDRTGEMVTPTGAAIAVAMADAWGAMPAMTVRGVGYGAGNRDDADMPNVLRLFTGDLATPAKRVLA